MLAAVEILDAIQARSFDLYIANHSAYKWIKLFQEPLATRPTDAERPSEKVITEASSSSERRKVTTETKRPISDGSEDDDLIDISIQTERTKFLSDFGFLLERKARMELAGKGKSQNSDLVRQMTISQNIMLQYARRVLFRDPVLSLKALNKESFEDLVLDVDFSVEDMRRFTELWKKQLEFGLLWMKDATMEALAMYPSAGKPEQTLLNVGHSHFPEHLFPMVGGWIFILPRILETMTNEAWWYLINALQPPSNIENRFVRICNNFDDLHSFLSFGALGIIDPPNFCTDSDDQGESSHASRNHLSLCGVAVADMMSARLSGVLPSQFPAKQRGCKTWAQIESRAWIFGAIRNEPDQFTKAFLDELCARPDLFVVVTRSDTDPDRKVESFGGSPSEPSYHTRSRMFEAPSAPPDQIPPGRGAWTVQRSPVDILYGADPCPGILTAVHRPSSAGWFFRLKNFPVKYFVILDATPGRHVRHITRSVAWAALRALKLAKGEYDAQSYEKASDVLFHKCASERLAWMSPGYGVGMTQPWRNG